jgi:hypothetical protein
LALLRLSLALLIVWREAQGAVTLVVAPEVVWAYGPKGYSGEGDDIVTFKNLYFGYSGDGLAATEWYPEAGRAVPAWWSLPSLASKVRAQDMGVNSRGFAVPWAMFVDYDDCFWLNGNYSVYPKPSERACMEVARTQEGYFVGLYGCPERTWSPEGGYSDPFVPLPVLNLRPV